MQIKYKGETHEIKGEKTLFDIAKELDVDLKEVLVAKVNGQLYDLSRKLDKDAEVEFLTFESNEGKKVFWHSSAHVLAAAVKKLYPDAVLGIGPPIDEGFYYDFYNLNVGDNDLEKLTKEAEKIIEKDEKFIRKESNVDEAREIVKDNKFKLEILNSLANDVTFYQNGDFVDLCRGPHIPSTRLIKAIKFTKVAGAYWRGNSKNEVMTRIYGISFPSKEQMNEYIKLSEEKKEHDHKKIGKDLELFFFSDISPGSPFFMPKGAAVYNELLKFAREIDFKYGYKEVITPIIAKVDLWKTSGHFDKYRENMFRASPFDSDEEYGLKPMNCPFSTLIFKSRTRSYKELPLRLADYGFLHRYELEGTMDGLLRTRLMEQNDAHVYVTEDQVEQEVLLLFKMLDEIYGKFNLSPIMVLATRPEKRIGADELWDKAEATLKKILDKSGYKYTVKEGDGAFYGPKIDIYVLDFTGKPDAAYAVSTIQLDFNLAARFGAVYVGADNKEHTPLVIHRSIMGTIGRFMGIILENSKGSLPLWVSPVQARVINITERNREYAAKVSKSLEEAGLRVELDDSSRTLEYKVRESQLIKAYYTIILGDKEESGNVIAIRTRDGKTKYNVKLDEFIEEATKKIKERTIN